MRASPRPVLVLRRVLGGAVAIASLTTGSRPAMADLPAIAPDKAEADARLDKGVKLFEEGRLEAALAEFREARRVYPLRAALFDAGLCLEKLQRYDEALDELEAALRESEAAGDAEIKNRAQRKVVDLRRRVGTIELDGAEPGAGVTVDGRSRGEYPLLAPLRVSEGSHLVRVTRGGFEPFEVQVDVAGGSTRHVEARLHALDRSGRLRVMTPGDQALAVVIDGEPVGKAPWEGSLAPGDHVVVLRGGGNLGTPPVRVAVEVDRTTALTLVAEALAAALRVEPVPVNASIALDGVTLGHGVWEGRLREGKHKVEVAAPGFLAAIEELTLGREARRDVRVELVRDPTSPFWSRPPRRPRFVLELGEAVALSPAFGGDATGGCSDGCRQRPRGGGYVLARLGYELGSGLGFGVAAGYLTVTQATMRRSTSVHVIGLPDDAALASDALRLRGMLAGAWAAMRFDTRFPFHVRLGAGALFGSLADERIGTVIGTVTLRSGGTAFGPLLETHASRFAYVAPEVRLGLPLGDRVELSLGLEALLLINPSPPRWDPTHAFYARADGAATFAGDTLVGSTMLVLAPGVGARYDF